MKQGFVTLKTGQQLHYRSVGQGAPLIMLHSSPQNSEAVMPAAHVFAKHCHCIALDTPGYGLSEPLSIQSPNIGDYAESIIAAIDMWGIKEFCIYGTATGSQIAIEIGKRYPDRVKFLMLDSNGHVDDSDRDHILKGYFPSVTPQYGGGHLLIYWEMCRSLFTAFPWTSGKVEDGFAIPLPPANIIQDVFLRYLDAGEKYDLAYKTAFYIEKRDHMDGLTVPTIMTRWACSPVISIADELIKLGLPECVTLLHSKGDITDRFNVQAKALSEKLCTLNLPDAHIPDTPVTGHDGFKSIFLGDQNQQVHAKINLNGMGDTIVFFHDSCRSGSQFTNKVAPLMGKRPIVILDLPGHGCSMPLVETPTVSGLAKMVATALQDLGIEKFEFIGVGLGLAIAVETAKHIKTINITAIETLELSDDEITDYLENGIPNLTPQHDGTHLVRAWYMVRAQALYRLWYKADGGSRHNLEDADLCPSSLHEKTKDLLRTKSYHADFISLKLNNKVTPLLKTTKGSGFNIHPSQLIDHLI